MRLLFVCSGNICRSAMAAAYARDRLARSGLCGVVVESAGTLGLEEERASPAAVQVLREGGLDLSGHRSRGLESVRPCAAEIVIGMERSHLEAVERLCGTSAQERHLLRAFEGGADPRGGAPDLEDPIGGPIEGYRECFEAIRACVDHLVARLERGS